MKRVVCFGELMLRLSPPGDERFFQSPHLRTWFGGSEANVAAGIAHLGGRSACVTRLPDNPIGDAAMAALRAEDIDVAGILRGGPRMGIYFVEKGADLRPMRVVYDRAGSAFATLDPAELDWPRLLDGAEWLHLSGITPALGDGPARAAIDAANMARSLGVKVSVDLNYRPALWSGRDPKTVVPDLVRGCDLLVGNPGAATAMLGVEVGEGDAGDPAFLRRAAAQIRAEYGCGLVAITLRDVVSASEHRWTAALWEGDTLHQARRWTVRVIDRVGGGDSFAAGLLYALQDGREPAEALEFATAAGALKLTIPGDFNRVSADEVDRALASPLR
ncbi:MAG TPA: sugar kinase [Longimicrobium sp.]|nr:sugar kinase [Longimicrobium sp.]